MAKLNKEAARKFAAWFSLNYENLRACIYDALWDEETATSASLLAYEAIETRSANVDDYKFYYLRAYHNERIDQAKRESAERKRAERCVDASEHVNLPEILAENSELEALAAEDLGARAMRYVVENYNAREASIFEIYVALQPKVSYTKLAKMLGVKRYHVWHVMLKIRKDLAQKFGPERQRLRTGGVDEVF